MPRGTFRFPGKRVGVALGGASILGFSDTGLTGQRTPATMCATMLDEMRVTDLEMEVRELARTLVGTQNMIRVAAEYRAKPSEGEDELSVTKRTLEGVQAALLKASEYQGRTQKRRRR